MQLRTLLTTALLLHLTSGLCQRPKGLPNAGEFFSSSVFANGTTVDYVCDPGYDLLGTPRRTCHSNGTWLPAALPFCVTDVAKGKTFHAPSLRTSIAKINKTSVLVDEIGAKNCSVFKRGRTHFWYVDLKALYQVQVLHINFGKRADRSDANATNILMFMGVGESVTELEKNQVCSEFSGALPYGISLYVPCLSTLRGSYVVVRLQSTKPLELSVCGFQVFSDLAVPVAERMRPTSPPGTKHNEPSAEDGSFVNYPLSKKVAVYVGVTAALASIGFSTLCLLIFVGRRICGRSQSSGDSLAQDATTVPSVLSPGTEPGRPERTRTMSSTLSDEPTLLSVLARRSTRYGSTKEEEFRQVTRRDIALRQETSMTSTDATLPVPEPSPLTRKVINYNESRLL
ncbi:hypothetical protein HPB50_020602 [Hyalomma asiaticum]|uniref:Uncharacterized protein n=1 Tax=Hyalomma asiaticum TaxID=266040 RepID=A0ACB7S800_HYAAI|nr:hypothetical protein HPB50_020602 [Hyalomma asiaticum]